MWHADDGIGWWMLWGALMMVVFWGAIMPLVVWLVQSVTRRDDGGAPAGSTPRRTPLAVAKERYARGEIGRDEFEQLKRDLEVAVAGLGAARMMTC